MDLKLRARFKIRKDFETKYMKMRGWKVSDLEEKLGFKKQQVSQTLTGTQEPTMNFLHRLCGLTGVPAEEIIETVFEK